MTTFTLLVVVGMTSGARHLAVPDYPTVESCRAAATAIIAQKKPQPAAEVYTACIPVTR